jgi:hypothetical protein
MKLMKGSFSILIGCGMLALAGCSVAPGYSLLDREQTPADTLTSEFIESFPQVDADTSRLAADDGGTLLWVAKGVQEGIMCLIIQSEGEGMGGLCGGPPVTISSVSTPTYSLYIDGVPTPEGHRKVSDNIFATTG